MTLRGRIVLPIVFGILYPHPEDGKPKTLCEMEIEARFWDWAGEPRIATALRSAGGDDAS